MRIYKTETVTLHNTDCLTLLAQLPDNGIDLIATDPPYYKVKGEAWDNQWRSKADFFAWLDSILTEYHRVLKPAGSLYLFAGPHLATQVDVAVSRRFNLLNHLIWRKPSGKHNCCNKESLRRYFPQTEHILFAESRKKTPFAFEPIRAYLDDSRTAANISRKQIDQACGCQMSGHWFDRSQWTFPSLAHYQSMDKLFGEVLKPYDQLKAEYKAIKQQRRHFAVTKHVHYTNVWDFKPVQWYPGKHPCEKPLDTFVGSGSTAIACRDLGRVFVGCEMGKAEFDGAVGRLEK